MIDRTLNYGRNVLARFLKKRKSCGSALDIGAGHGDDLAIVSRFYPEARRHAIECYPPYVKELQAQGVKVETLNIERDEFPFNTESLDVVIANQILEHTKEIFWILDQTSNVLKVGGSLLIGVPNLAALHNRVLLAVGRQPSPLKNNSAHIRGFTKPDVRALLDSVWPGGYHLKGFGGGNFYPFPPVIARPLAWLFPTMAASIFFHFVKQKPYQREFLKYPVEQKLETNFFLGR
jgi:SAM-dependent methyltransferase